MSSDASNGEAKSLMDVDVRDVVPDLSLGSEPSTPSSAKSSLNGVNMAFDSMGNTKCGGTVGSYG